MKKEEKLQQSYENELNKFRERQSTKHLNYTKELERIDLQILKLQQRRNELHDLMNKNQEKTFRSFQEFRDHSAKQSELSKTKESRLLSSSAPVD